MYHVLGICGIEREIKKQTKKTTLMNKEKSCWVSVPADIYFLPWKSSVHKFVSTIWQAVNGHNLAGMSPRPFSLRLKKRVGTFVYGMIRDNKW